MAPHASRLLGELDPMYPSSDGKPMAENTEQAKWIVLFGENLRAAFPNDFVATDLLWYPVQGKPKICAAPDALIALGRPPGPRHSYMTWREGGVNPQVVVEVWSPSNDAADNAQRLRFFEAHGVHEVYGYDPDGNTLTVWWRGEDGLAEVPVVGSVVSPRLGVRFEPGKPALKLFRPDGRPFQSFAELEAERDAARAATERERAAKRRAAANARARTARERARAERAESEVKRAKQEFDGALVQAGQARAQADQARAQADQARAQADAERARAEQERARAEALLARLRAAGLAD